MPSWWLHPAVAVPWQVTLHSVLAAAVLLSWARRRGLPPGRPRRVLLGLVLVLPLVTAAVPGRYGFGFREGWAWFDSLRLLAVPVPLPGVGPLHLYHGVLGVAVATLGVSIYQELVPLVRRRFRREAATVAPPALERRVRALPGWGRCRVAILPGRRLHAATGGRPGRPRLWLSAGIPELPEAQLDAVLRHELAHWRRGHWWGPHLLYVARLVQLFNPVALWAFREYTVETEIACDAAAVAGRDPRPLARVLLRLYEESSRPAARSQLRRRVDVLLGRHPEGEPVPVAAVWWAGGLLLVLLLWIV